MGKVQNFSNPERYALSSESVGMDGIVVSVMPF
jgi:hypothetical protein